MSKHNDIADAIKACLQTIRKASGFNTDTGLQVFRGKTQAPEESLVLFEDEEDVLDQKGRPIACKVRAPYVVEGTTACAAEDPNAAAQALADDITRALWPEVEDPVLKVLLTAELAYAGRRILPREGGQNLVTVQVKFNATFVFNPGNP